MAKRESSLKNMILTLFLVTLMASSVLAFVHQLTAEPIAAAKLRKQVEALKAVLPEFNNAPIDDKTTIKPEGSAYDLEVYPAKNGDELLGLAVKSYSANGYSGEIWVMVGFDTNGHIINYTVLEHKETPGLGDNMQKDFFRKQFTGLNPEEKTIAVAKDGGDIDAITAATITSRAFCEATHRAVAAYKQYMQNQ